MPAVLSIEEYLRRRIELTVSCRDTDGIPKVPGAGHVGDGVQIMHNGVRVVEGGYCGDWMTEIIRRLDGHHEPQEEVVFHEIIERLAETSPADPVMFELGAFWAYFSLWFLDRFPNGRSFLVEPDPANLAVGQRNFELNGRTGEFIHAAVGAEPAPPSPFPCESDNVVREIPTESLTSVALRFGVGHVDLVLADVQGAELALLEGASEWLSADHVRFLVISTHHHEISGDPLIHERCLELLTSLGAHIICEHTVAESFSGDGLIAASMDPRDRDMHVSVSLPRARESLFGDPLVDLARVSEDRAAARAELADLQGQLDGTREELAEVRRELDAIVATKTWRARNLAVDRLRPLLHR